MEADEFTLTFRLIAKIPNSKNQKQIVILMAFYFVSIEKEEFTWDDFMDEPFETDVELTRNDIYTIAWKIGVMKEDFQNEQVQKLLVFIRNHCERNGSPLIEWLKVQMRVRKSIIEGPI